MQHTSCTTAASPPALGLRGRGGTSARTQLLPEVTSECQHARWRPITGRTRQGGGKCRYGSPAPRPLGPGWQLRAHLQRADGSGRGGPGSGRGRVGRGAAGGEGWGRGANGLRKGQGAAGRAPPWAPHRDPGVLGWERGAAGCPLSRGLGLAGSGLARSPPTCLPLASLPPRRSALAASSRGLRALPLQAGGGGVRGPARGRGGAAECRPACGCSAEEPARGSPLPFFYMRELSALVRWERRDSVPVLVGKT